MIDEVTTIVDTDGSMFIIVSSHEEAPDFFEVRTNIPHMEALTELLSHAAKAIATAAEDHTPFQFAARDA